MIHIVDARHAQPGAVYGLTGVWQHLGPRLGQGHAVTRPREQHGAQFTLKLFDLL